MGGHLLGVNVEANQIVQKSDISLGRPQGDRIVQTVVAFSPDGGAVYLGLLGDEESGHGLAGRVAAYDVASGQQFWLTSPSTPAFSLAPSRDGRWLYIANPFKRSLVVLETQTGREVKFIGGLGRTPALPIQGQK